MRGEIAGKDRAVSFGEQAEEFIVFELAEMLWQTRPKDLYLRNNIHIVNVKTFLSF